MNSERDTSEPLIGPAVASGSQVCAIGDIHGRLDLLEDLLGKLDDEARAGQPQQLVFLGDYVDRGSQSARVIHRLLKLRAERPETVFLKGNHEEALLDFLAMPEAMEDWFEWGGLQTLESYGLKGVDARAPEDLRDELAERLPDSHFRFLMRLRSCHQDGDYVFVHAGLRAGIAFEKQRERDLLWIRDEFFDTRAEDWDRYCIVHGHTPQNKPENLSWRINVDTCAYSSGRLSAVVLEGDQRRFVST